MKKINTIVSVTLMTIMTILVTACSENTQTVEWYIEHPDVLEKESEKCKIKPPAELAKDKHCTVIIQAQRKVFHEHQRNAPIPTFK